MELTASRSRTSAVAAMSQPQRNAGGRPGGAAAHRGRARGRPGDVHRAGRGHRAGQEHHVAAADRAGAGRPGPPRRPRPVPARARCSSGTPGAAAPRPGLVEVAQPFLDRLGEADRRDGQPGRGPRRHGRADRPGGQHVPDRRDQLARPAGAAALRGARQGAARLRRGRAAAGPPGAAHRADHHQPGRAARPTCAEVRAPRLRDHRRGARARPGRGGRPGVPGRRRPWSPRCRSPAPPRG